MPTEFTLPELGENIAAGDVVRVLVSPGDTIAKDQAVLELETDKATIEVPSSVAGTVGEVRVKPGDKVKVGQVVLTVDDGAAAKGEEGGGAEGGGARRAEAQGGRDKKSGPKGKVVAEPTADERAADISGRGAALAPPSAARARSRGRPRRLPSLRTPRPTMRRKRRRRRRNAAKWSTSAARAMLPAGRTGRHRPGRPRGALRAPAGARARRRDPARPGQWSGRPDRRRGRAAVRARRRWPTAAARPPPAPGSPALPDFTKWGEVERKPMSNIRRKTAEHLGHAWRAIPHVTQHDKADITGIEALRKQFGAQAEKAGGKLTVTAIALKIVAAALRKFPQFNSSIDTASERDRLQEVRPRRRRRRHRARPAGAGHPRRRPEGHRAAVGGAGEGVGEGPRRQAVARRHAGRRFHDHQPRRHRRHVVHADRQLAGGRDPRHVARRAGAGLERPGVRAAADAAAVAVLRSPGHRRRRRRRGSCAGSPRRSSSRS